MNHHPADQPFINDILQKLPTSIAASVRNTYSYQYEQQGRQAANLYLLSVEDYITGKTLLTHSDDTIRTKAERCAKVCNVNSQDLRGKHKNAGAKKHPGTCSLITKRS